MLGQFYVKSQHRTTEVPNDAGMLALVRKGNGRGYIDYLGQAPLPQGGGVLSCNEANAAVGEDQAHHAN